MGTRQVTGDLKKVLNKLCAIRIATAQCTMAGQVYKDLWYQLISGIPHKGIKVSESLLRESSSLRKKRGSSLYVHDLEATSRCVSIKLCSPCCCAAMLITALHLQTWFLYPENSSKCSTAESFASLYWCARRKRSDFAESKHFCCFSVSRHFAGLSQIKPSQHLGTLCTTYSQKPAEAVNQVLVDNYSRAG